MLCLQHVLAPSSSACARTGPSACFSTATLAAAPFVEFCVNCAICASFEDQLAFQRLCAYIFVCAFVGQTLMARLSSNILLLSSKRRNFDWADELAGPPQSAIFPPISHPYSFYPPSPLLLPLCAKDSRSRRQWWGTYQCEPECRLVPLQAGTRINTDTHTDTFAVSSCLSPLSIQCLCLCLYPCERYQAEVNNVLSTIDLSGRSYEREREERGKWRGRDQCYSV